MLLVVGLLICMGQYTVMFFFASARLRKNVYVTLNYDTASDTVWQQAGNLKNAGDNSQK